MEKQASYRCLLFLLRSEDHFIYFHPSPSRILPKPPRRLPSFLTVVRSISQDAAGQPADGQCLDPDLTRTTQCCEEQPFTSKQCILDATYKLDIVIDGLCVSHQATSIHAEEFSCLQFSFKHVTTCMYEGHTITFQLLHDETFSTKQGLYPVYAGTRCLRSRLWRRKGKRLFVQRSFLPSDSGQGE